MILKLLDDGSYRNMTITYFPSLALFSQEMRPWGNGTAIEVVVTYHDPDSEAIPCLSLPLVPITEGLELVDVVLHRSPAKAYKMQARFNEWFSSCLGYEIMLVYLGPHLRPVLGNLSSNQSDCKGTMSVSWLRSMMSRVPFAGSIQPEVPEGLTFADVAPYLVVTERSLEDVSNRLPEGEDMDMTKFRPNIVLSGSDHAYDEDFWGGLAIHCAVDDPSEDRSIKLDLTQNCARCASLNVDYKTGRLGTGESGAILKKLMRDRRIDKGAKYSPIFGRYGFLDSSCAEGRISIGDSVVVTKRNADRTTFGKIDPVCT